MALFDKLQRALNADAGEAVLAPPAPPERAIGTVSMGAARATRAAPESLDGRSRAEGPGEPASAGAPDSGEPGRQVLPVVFTGAAGALQRAVEQADAHLSPRDRELVYEKRDWCRLAWDTWQARPSDDQRPPSLEAVCLRLAMQYPDRWPLMRTAGKLGKSLLNAKATARWWREDMGMVQGHPNWDNWQALAPDWARGKREKPAQQQAFIQQVMRLFLHPNKPKLLKCYRKVHRLWEDEGMAALAPTFRVVKLYEESINPRVAIRARDGAQVYANTVRGWIHRHCNRLPGEAFVADHRTMDFWVRMPHPQNPDEWLAVRPYITIVEDVTTGVIVKALIYADQHPNHLRILETLQEAIRAAGNVPPLIWYTDQGKDFLKYAFTTPITLKTAAGDLLHDGENPYRHCVLAELHAKHKEARGYNGKEKTAERRFADVADDFDKMQVGYCGNSPRTRPDYGETWEGDVMRLPAPGQVIEQFNDWLANEYNCRADADGRPRIQLWNARPRNRQPLSDQELLFAMLLPQAVCLLVGRSPYGTGGVTHRGWTYSHLALREYWGKPVMVKTYWGMPEVAEDGHTHPAGIFCFTPDGRFLCAVAADRTGAMFADTPAEQDVLGQLSHIINAAAKTDRDEFEQHTGRRMLTSPDVALRGLPGHGPVPAAGTAIGGTPGGHRRLRAASNVPPADSAATSSPGGHTPTAESAPSTLDMAGVHDAMMDFARAQRTADDDDEETGTNAPMEMNTRRDEDECD